MQAKDIMTKDVDVIQKSASLVEAAQKMKRLNVGSLPISDGAKVSGIITDRDIVVRSTAESHDPNEVTVGDIMSTDIIYCYADQDVSEVGKLMGEKQIRRLPVLDRNMELVGIISLGDLSVEVTKDQVSADALEKISQPAKPKH